jgi:serine/threonine-protein phosphatase 2A regulatory subunit B''
MLLAQPDTTRIVPFDFMPFLEELLAFHPGLAFLESTPEFQEKYARTVIARIMYMLDPLGRGFIDGRSLRKSNLIQAFHTVDMEEDINLVRAVCHAGVLPTFDAVVLLRSVDCAR